MGHFFSFFPFFLLVTAKVFASHNKDFTLSQGEKSLYTRKKESHVARDLNMGESRIFKPLGYSFYPYILIYWALQCTMCSTE